MSRRRKPAQAKAPRVSEVIELAPGPDGASVLEFTADGVVSVQVYAITAADNAAAAELAERMRQACSIPPAPPRETPWGEGQFDVVELGPGVRAAVRVTPAGDVVMLCPGGELTITAGACTLGLGLLEASRRAAERRVELEERARRRADKRRPR